MPLGQPDVSLVDKCYVWGLDGLGRWGGTQRFQNHRCWLMGTQAPVLKYEICVILNLDYES